MNAKINRKKYHRNLLIIFAALIVVLDVLFIVLPSKDMSETENRNLTKRPKVTFATVTNGKYEAQFDKYISDQFPFRDFWVKLEGTISRMFGRTESGGVYLGKDGYLIQNFTEPSEEDYEQTMDAIKSFKQKNGKLKMYALIAPTALTIYDNKLPFNAPAGDEDAFLDKTYESLNSMDIQAVDIRQELKERRDDHQLYYRTDHHWTTDGALAAFEIMSSQTGWAGTSLIYNRLLVSNQFTGTLASTSGFKSDETDEIYVYEPQAGFKSTIFYVEEAMKTKIPYAVEKLDTKDKYGLFFDGNHAQVTITTGSKNGKTLLVLKDSYANCFVPFLFSDYEKIVMVDPRYYTEDLDMLMKVEEIDEVLFLYNAHTFAEDKNLINTL